MRENAGMDGAEGANRELREDEEFAALVPDPTGSEYRELERSIRAEGLREPIVVWRPPREGAEPPLLVDGHNRYRVCVKHGVSFEDKVVERHFASREEAKAWVLITHLGRRNLTMAGRCEVALRIEDMLEPLARERQREAGKSHGRGKKGSGTESESNETEAGESEQKLVPDLVEAISRLHPSAAKAGRARVQAAKAAGVGAESLRKYKVVKEAAENETRPEVKKEAKNQLRRLRGTTPGTSINRAYGKWKSAKERADRADSFSDTTGEAEEGWADYSDDERPVAKGEENGGTGSTPRHPTPDGNGTSSATVPDAESDSASTSDGAAAESSGSEWTARNPRWRHGEFQTVIDTLPNDSVGLILTDPPYGVGRADIPGDKDIENAEKLLARMLELIKPKLTKGAHVVVFTAEMDSLKARMRAKLEDCGYLYVDDRPLVWMKTDLSGNPKGYPRRDDQNASSLLPSYEQALHGIAGEAGLEWKGQPNGFVVPQGIGRDYYQHPTAKPVSMLQRIIESTLTRGKAIVADPFGGSATTLEAAMRAGRHAWGTEKWRKYYEAGMARINDVRHELETVPQPALFEMVLQPAPGTSVPGGIHYGRSWELPVPGTIWGFGAPPAEIQIEAGLRYGEVWVEYHDIYFDDSHDEPEHNGWYVFIGLESSGEGVFFPEILGPFDGRAKAERAFREYTQPWNRTHNFHIDEPEDGDFSDF